MILLKCILQKQNVSLWNRFTWIRTGSSSGLLWKR